jgi:uncharacterized protein (TIGR02466 family)
MEMDINQKLQQAITTHKEGKLEEAERLYLDILKIQPMHAVTHNNLGVILKKARRLEEAEISFKKAIESKPDYADAHNNLGNTLKRFGRLEEAEESFKKATKFKPDYAVAYYNLGVLLKDLDRLEEAEINFIKATEFKPDFADAHNNLGNTLQELRKLKEAETSYNKGIELKPNYAVIYNNLGIVLKDLGKLEEAEESFKKAIELKSDFEIALLHKGQILFEKGEFELALRDFDSCNTGDSRGRALSSLYALGRIDDIYQRIEKHSELDDENINVAAFSSFIAAKEGKETAHEFCRNPIDFIHFSKLSSHIKNSNLFITEVIEELYNINTRWEPLGRTTYNGFHSGNKINVFKNPSAKLNNLKSIIIDELDAYYLKFKNESCSYIKKWPSKNNLNQSWYVILKQQGYQSAHIHPGGWLSGVIYLKTVPVLKNNEGAIEFSLNGQHYSDINSPKLIHQPKVGDIIFFPSSLHHRTIPFTTDADRIIISFDLMSPKESNIHSSHS